MRLWFILMTSTRGGQLKNSEKGLSHLYMLNCLIPRDTARVMTVKKNRSAESLLLGIRG